MILSPDHLGPPTVRWPLLTQCDRFRKNLRISGLRLPQHWTVPLTVTRLHLRGLALASVLSLGGYLHLMSVCHWLGRSGGMRAGALWHTIAVNPVALHSVAHTVSKQIPAILEMSRGCHATSPIPPKKRPCRTYRATPLSLCHGKAPCKNGSR